MSAGDRNSPATGAEPGAAGDLSILSVNLSPEKGTVKRPAPEGRIDARGLAGDAHAGMGDRQISLLGVEAIERFSQVLGRPISPGEFAENLTVRGLDAGAVALFDRFHVGPAELEVTQIGKECHHRCAIFAAVGDCVMPREGVFARVVRGGRVAVGDVIGSARGLCD